MSDGHLACLELLRWISFGIYSVAAQRRCHQSQGFIMGQNLRKSAGSSVSTDSTDAVVPSSVSYLRLHVVDGDVSFFGLPEIKIYY